MSTLTAEQVNAIFDEHQAKFSGLKNQIDELRTIYTTKMWHQMGDAMLKYVKSRDFDLSDNNELVDLYKKMIEKLSDRLNPLKYALITIACSRHFEGK